MATVGQVYYNIIDPGSNGYISSGQDIFSDIVAAYGATRFNKLGIQAPPGTQVVLNSSKNIMIGRTGMYELDDDIAITNMYFVRPKNYVLDETQAEAAITSGVQMIVDAKQTYTTEVSRLDGSYQEGVEDANENFEAQKALLDPTSATYEEDLARLEAELETALETLEANYIANLDQAKTTYDEDYDEGFSLYQSGVRGIYVLDEDNPYRDLFNIIVDFIWE